MIYFSPHPIGEEEQMKNHSRDLEYIDELRMQHRRLIPLICICEDCQYTFETGSMPERCPDCGRLKLRQVTAQEAEAYRKIRAEIEKEKQQG